MPGSIEKRGQRKEAEKELALLFADVKEGKAISAKQVTVRALADRWMREHVKPNLSETTAENYRYFLDSAILPKLGHLKVHELSTYAIDSFLSELKTEKGLSDTSRRHYCSTISAMLGKAKKWKIIKINPMDEVDKPVPDTEPAQFYDDEQAKILIDALQEAPIKYRAAVYIALFGGLRLGETVGLRWGDINFKSAELSISRSLQYIPKRGTFISAPKGGRTRNKKGDKGEKKSNKTRKITMPRIAMDCLRQYKTWQDEQAAQLGDSWQGAGYLFTAWNGKPMHPDTPSKWLHRFLERNSLPPLTYHSLRHTSATLLIAEGLDIETIKERLGHSKASITSDIYGHALKRKDKESAVVLDNLFADKA